MLGRLFSNGRKPAATPAHAEGKRLFDLGVAHAARHDCDTALDCFARSIAANPNPAPYIERAQILQRRIRPAEALHDIQTATRLDQAQGCEFTTVLTQETALLRLLTENHRNGQRERLIADLRQGDDREIARQILCACFGLRLAAWVNGSCPDLVAFHFFSELDIIARFESPTTYPEATELHDAYGPAFIAKKLAEGANAQAFVEANFKLHGFLGSYDPADMRGLRGTMLWEIHCNMMMRDYGYFWDTLGSDCPGITAEAVAFQAIPRPSPPPLAHKPTSVGGVALVLDDDGEIDGGALVCGLVDQVQALSTTELDLYRYLMEECDRLAAGGAFQARIAAACGISAVEYEGESARAPHFAANRAAMTYLDGQVEPVLSDALGDQIAPSIRAKVFGQFYVRNLDLITALRLKYAVHFHNARLAAGHYDQADRWSAVITDLQRLQSLRA